MILMISGKAESGKTTLANFLRRILENEEKTVKIFPFADNVKHIARDMGWDGVKNEKGRGLLQYIGKIGRSYDKNIWVDKVINEICYASNPSDVVIIDDVRYLNEIDQMTKFSNDVVLIRINRPNHINSLTQDQKQDGSETELDTYEDFDFEITNDGSKNDLFDKTKTLYEELFSCLH